MHGGSGLPVRWRALASERSLTSAPSSSGDERGCQRPARLLIRCTNNTSKDDTQEANDQAVFASRFENVETLARHSLSQAVRRILADMDAELAPFTPHDLRRTGATIAQAARLPVDFVKALLNHNDKGVTGIYARWHMFEEKREAVMAIEAAVSPLIERSHTPTAFTCPTHVLRR